MATLLYGDCLEKMKGMADKSIDLIICDLPFGCLTIQTYKGVIDKSKSDLGKTYGEKLTWDIKIDLELFWKEIKRIRKNEHTPCLMFCTTKFGFDLYNSNPKEFRYDLVWSKSNAVGFLSANKKPMSSHEMIYVFSKAGAKYNRIDLLGDYPKGGGGRSCANFLPINNIPNTGTTVEGKRCIKSVIEVSNKKEKGGHPTAKSIELYKFLIERYSDVGDTVLDPTFGSCNSGIASIELRRRYVGVEKNNVFFWKAVNKIVV